MLVRLGYVAMSVHLKNASPSQTMTYDSFSGLMIEEAAIRNSKESLIRIWKIAYDY